MNEEEKRELEKLRAKDTLTDEETTRAAVLEELEAAEADISDEDEFDAAFAEATGKESPKKDESEKEEEDELAKKKEEKQHPK